VEGGANDIGGRPWLGYAVSCGIVLAAVIAFAVLLAGAIGEDDEGSAATEASGGPAATDTSRDDPRGELSSGSLLPDGGLFRVPKEVAGVRAAAEAAGCDLRTFKVATRDHVPEIDRKIEYSSDPPTSGLHYPIPAADGAYDESPDVKMLVHTLEHSRVIIWFDRDLPRESRASLKAYYDHDARQLVLVPDTTGMTYEVAATAWHRNPQPNGRGRLLGCPEYNDAVYTALEVFKAKNRGRGPERIP